MSSTESAAAHEDHDVVVVPARPGRLTSLAELTQSRNEIDMVLDEMFGQVDTDGPGATDAVLVTGGVCAVAGALIAGLPAVVLGAGIASIGLGSILPIRSAIRRGKQGVHLRKMRNLIGDGQVLNVSAASTKQLADGHNAVIKMVDEDSVLGVRVRSIAHGLVEEVASLLEGRAPSTARQEQYLAERFTALEELRNAVQLAASDTAVVDAAVTARLEVESVADRSALTEAAELTQDLSGDR